MLTNEWTGGHTHGRTARPTGGRSDKQTQADRQTDRLIGRYGWTYTQTHRQIDGNGTSDEMNCDLSNVNHLLQNRTVRHSVAQSSAAPKVSPVLRGRIEETLRSTVGAYPGAVWNLLGRRDRGRGWGVRKGNSAIR
jgi:hypothetical protein